MNDVESAVPLSHASYNNEASENDFEKGRIQIGFANAKDGQTSKKNEMHEESKKNGHPFKPHNVCSKPTIYISDSAPLHSSWLGQWPCPLVPKFEFPLSLALK